MRKMNILLLILLSGLSYPQEIDTWERGYGTELKESAKQIVLLQDGNFLVNAEKRIDQYGFTNLIWLIAIDQNGDSLWTKVIGDSIRDEYINDMRINQTGDLFVASGNQSAPGIYQRAYLSKKTDAYQNIWTKTYANSYEAYYIWFSIVVPTDDGGCGAVLYYQYNFSGGEQSAHKYDKNGDIVKSYYPTYQINDTTSHYSALISELYQSKDGCFYILESKVENPEYRRESLIKLDRNFDLEWERTYDINEEYYTTYGFEPTEEGDFIVINSDGLVKLDREANIIWTNSINNLNTLESAGDGNFYASGGSKTIKFNKDGQIIWEKDFGGNSLVLADDGGCILVGSKSNDVWICKFDQDGNYVNINNFVCTVDGYELHQNYPNPFNPVTMIRYSLADDVDVKLAVFDITGREVAELVSGRQMKGNYSVNFNAEKLTSGIYFYRLSIDGKAVQSRKMMMLK